MARVLGLKEEATYGVASDTVPDWHQEVSKAKAGPNSEPLTYSGGSRSIKKAKAGAMKPEASYDMKCDLKRIGHYLKAYLGNYKFTSGAAALNTHEFWGAENTSLPSFTGWSTFDYFMKELVGMLCESLKLEVSDEFLDGTAEWKYKDETQIAEVPEPADQKMIPDDTLIAFYDIALLLEGNAPPGVVSSFSFDGKNNLNVDKKIGLGSRKPQGKAKAQAREIKLELEATLEQETVELIQKAEYGAVGNSPSDCKLYHLPMKVTITFCEDVADNLELFFPDCIFSAEYESSDADEIDVKFTLQTLSTTKVTLDDGTTKIVTDMYAKLENDQPEIKPGASGTSSVAITVKDNAATAVVGAIVTLTDRMTGTVLTSAATSAAGLCTIASVPFSSYDVSVKDAEAATMVMTTTKISVNEATETVTLTEKAA